jgi:hypothetical protein
MPAIPSQTLPMPFQTGLQQKTDPRYVSLGAQTTVQNGYYQKQGVITTRFGYSVLGKGIVGGGTIGSAMRLGTLGSMLTMSDGVSYYSYSPAADQWTNIDYISPLNAWRDSVVEWGTKVNSFDTAYVPSGGTNGGGFIVTLWCAQAYGQTNNQLFATVQDATSGDLVFANYAVTATTLNVQFARIVTVGNYGVIAYKDSSIGGNLWAIALNCSTGVPSWGSASNIITDFDTTGGPDQSLWDVCNVSSTLWAIVYPQNPGANKWSRLVTYNTALTLQQSVLFPQIGGRNTPGHSYAVTADANNIWTAVAYDDGANTQTFVRASNPSTLAVNLAETSIAQQDTGTAVRRTSIGVVNSTTAIIAHSGIIDQANGIRWAQINTSGTVTGSARQLFNHSVAGKIFIQNGRTYVGAACQVNLTAYTQIPPVTQSANQGAYLLVDLDAGNTTGTQQAGFPVACLGPRIANVVSATSPYGNSSSLVSNTSNVSGTRWIGVGSYAGASTDRASIQTMTYDFAGNRMQHAELGGTAFISGGILSQFDGTLVTEVSFLHPPPTVSLAAAAGGSLTANGVYTYYVAYGYTDAKGNLHLSASAVGSITLSGANQTVNLTVTNLSSTLRQDAANSFSPPVQIYIWRNQNGGATFYLLNSDAGTPTSTPNTYTQAIADTASDSTISSNGYGTWPFAGGALESYCPSACLGVLTHNGKIWAMSDDRKTWVYSTDTSPPRWSDSNRYTISDGGPATGWASIDNQLITFKANKIFVTRGQGNDDLGLNSDLQTVALPGSRGCIEPRSVLVVASLGVFFQSTDSGIYLLTRGGLEVEFVGAPVEDVTKANPVIKKAVAVPRRNEIRFDCAPSESSATGTTVVYNTHFKLWTTALYYDTDAPQAGAANVDSTQVGNDFYRAVSGGRVYKEYTDPTATNAFTDNGTFVSLVVETANAKAEWIEGWARFRRFFATCEQLSPADLTLQVALDYGAYGQSQTWTAAQMASWTGPLKTGQIQIGPQQKAAAVRMKLSTSTPTGFAVGTGQGLSFVGAALEIAKYEKPYRLPPPQRG